MNKIQNSINLKDELNFFEMILRVDGIVEIQLLPKHEIDDEQVKILIKKTLELTGGVLSPTLIRVGEFVTFTSKAKSFSATAEGKSACTCEAYVINNMGHGIIGNLYLRVNKPVKPVKIFWDEEEAVEWLKKVNK